LRSNVAIIHPLLIVLPNQPNQPFFLKIKNPSYEKQNLAPAADMAACYELCNTLVIVVL
jgi:hypothetical protein